MLQKESYLMLRGWEVGIGRNALLARFHDFDARSELSEVGLFLAKSPAHGIFTGYIHRETA
jgi:hypothetical protein